MGEFDLSLIREFRSRPAFYDRNSPRFKDKVYTAHEWQEISNKLGYDVSLLKDRMLQLRNRYNLEKRRLEQLREEQPGKPFDSPWPLYEQLHFLSDHIRARRSYKRMLPISQTHPAIAIPNVTTPGVGIAADLSNSGSNFSSGANAAPYANGLVAVKMEDEWDIESTSRSLPDDKHRFNPGDHPTMVAHAQLLGHSNTSPDDAMTMAQRATRQFANATSIPSITIKRLDALRNDVGITSIPMPSSSTSTSAATVAAAAAKPINHNNWSTRSNNNSTLHETDGPNASKLRRYYNARENKYAAFGSFVTSSLLELPPCKALKLVEKFTSEVVQLLIQSDSGGNADAPPNGSNANISNMSDLQI